jgi:hypothetical protein
MIFAAGRTLHDLNYVDLFGEDYAECVELRLVAGTLRQWGLASAEARRWCARFRAVAGCAPYSPESR